MQTYITKSVMNKKTSVRIMHKIQFRMLLQWLPKYIETKKLTACFLKKQKEVRN